MFRAAENSLLLVSQIDSLHSSFVPSAQGASLAQPGHRRQMGQLLWRFINFSNYSKRVFKVPARRSAPTGADQGSA
jgi:hypothetical protein